MLIGMQTLVQPLGCPFDVLLQTTVINFLNKDQSITLHEPGTGRPLTVPTMLRGKCLLLTRKKDFQDNSSISISEPTCDAQIIAYTPLDTIHVPDSHINTYLHLSEPIQ